MRDYQTLFFSDDFSFNLIQSTRKKELSDAASQAVEEIWEHEQKNRTGSLFNGQVLSLVSLDRQGLQAEFVEYKHYLASLRKPKLRSVLGVKPLSLSCLTRSMGSVLMARRAKGVAQYPLWYELAPSGGIGPEAAKGDKLDVAGQALRELTEETGISKKSVLKVHPFSLVFDDQTGLYEICLEIELNPQILKEPLPPTEEYQDLQWLTPADLTGFIEANRKRIVPLSIYLLELHNLC